MKKNHAFTAYALQVNNKKNFFKVWESERIIKITSRHLFDNKIAILVKILFTGFFLFFFNSHAPKYWEFYLLKMFKHEAYKFGKEYGNEIILYALVF